MTNCNAKITAAILVKFTAFTIKFFLSDKNSLALPVCSVLNHFSVANIIVENNKVFIVRDTILDLVQVEPVYFKESTAVVRGLANGTEVLTKTIPGAYEGMRVKTVD